MSWTIPRFDYLVDFAGASHTGNVRPSNEDVWRVDPGLGIFVVADGMGGHAAGEVAARLAVDALFATLRSPEALRTVEQYVTSSELEARRQVFDLVERGIGKAHEAVLEVASKDIKRRGMGCTIDAALLLGTKAFLAHVGDSRSYLSRPNTTIQLTHDHTMHGTLVARGLVAPSEPPRAKNLLTNAVGRKGTLEVDEVLVDLSEGDRLLLCTDGIHGELGDERVISELSRKGTPSETAETIVKSALDRGGKDNATVIVVEIGGRRINRAGAEAGISARDNSFAAHSDLFAGLPAALVERALRAAVEVEFEPNDSVPRFFTGDRVGYIVLEGRINSPDGWALGPSALVYPESLARGGQGTTLSVASERTRALRIRADDFQEVCAADTRLAAKLYEKLTKLLGKALS
jgi:PPM family protein phosphatase